MNLVYNAAEIATTFIEGYLMLSTIVLFCGKRYEEPKNYRLLLAGTAFYTVVILLFNNLEAGITQTVLAAMLIAISYSYYLSSASLIYRALVAAQCQMVLMAMDLIMSAFVDVLFANIGVDIHMIDEPGPVRLAYIFTVKGLEVLAYLLVKRKLKNPPELTRKVILQYLVFATAICFAAKYMYDAILSPSMHDMQISVIIAWVLVLVAMFCIQRIFSLQRDREKAEEEAHTVVTLSKVMEESYRQLEDEVKSRAGVMHDINHHLDAVRQMLAADEAQEARAYVEQLTEERLSGASLVFSGVPVVDAVLNSHLARAKRLHILTQVQVRFLPELESVRPTDLCIVLSNLLSNAIEACTQLPEEKRELTVALNQTGPMLVLKVTNTAKENPVENGMETTKEDQRSHGWGIKNVRAALKKYSGFLEYSFENGIVIAMAFFGSAGQNSTE